MTWSISQVLGHYRQIKNVESIIGLLEWDMESFLPEASVSSRERQLGYLYDELFKAQTQASFVEAVFDKHNPSELEAKMLTKLRVEVAKRTALDPDFVQQSTRAKVRGLESWKKARREKNFKVVEADLAELLRLKREEVQRLAAHPRLKEHLKGLSPYEILLDDYEPGFRANDLRSLLDTLVAGTRERLPLILEKQKSKGWKPKTYPMPRVAQKELGHKILKALGFPFEKGRLDESAHPFCGGNPEDIRMTTKYFDEDFLGALYSTIHECGHGIYEASIPGEYMYTPAGSGATNGIHESQSRV
jgi:carboxypeptidase Taq